MIRKLLYVFILIFAFFAGKAQHTPLLTQYMFNGLAYNPGFAGSDEALSISVSDRNQWVGFDGAPVTQTLAIHTPLKNENIGLGILLYRDVIGKSHDNGIYGTYAYRIKLGTGKLSMGITGGFSFKQIKLSEATVIQQGDEAFSKNTPLCFLPNFSIGAYYYSSGFFVGLSSPFIFYEKVNIETDRLISSFDFSKDNFLLTAGYNYKINSLYAVKPSFLWRTNLTTGSQFEMDLTAEHIKFGGIGFGYRIKDAAMILLKVRINNQMFFGYSYGIPISKLSNYNSGTHEFYLTYQFKYESKTVSSRFF